MFKWAYKETSAGRTEPARNPAVQLRAALAKLDCADIAVSINDGKRAYIS